MFAQISLKDLLIPSLRTSMNIIRYLSYVSTMLKFSGPTVVQLLTLIETYFLTVVDCIFLTNV